MKAAVTLMLAALIALLAASAAPAAIFRDVPTDSWVYDVTDELQERGILEGHPSWGTPVALSRYEMAMVAARALEKLEDEELMAKVDYHLALQVLGLIGEFEVELENIYSCPAAVGLVVNWPKEIIARLADEKLFIPLIGE